MSHDPKNRSEPSRTDPLSEPTVNRRIWGAYLEAGFNRSSWSGALDMSYQGVDLIDSGKVVPLLATLVRMQELIGKYSLDQLVFGHHPPTAKRLEPVLSNEAVTALVYQLRCDQETRAALGEFSDSSEAKYLRLTRTYVTAWTERYASAHAEGLDRKDATAEAVRHAEAMQTKADAVAAGVRPVTPAQLAAAGKVLQRSKRKRKASRIDLVTAPVPRRRKRAGS